MSNANPEKPNLEAALSSTPVAAKKSRFRPTFRSPRIPRETKLGLAIIFSLVCVFGYVLYSRLTRPANMDAEQFAAQSNSPLAPSVTSTEPTALTAQPAGMAGQPTNLVAQPAGHSPAMFSGAAPQNTMPLTTPTTQPNVPTQYGAPAGGAGQAAWTPNASSPGATQPSSDPFMNRSAATPSSASGAASSFSANGFGANSTAGSTAPSPTAPAATPSYGLSDTNDAEGPRNSFNPLPPADRATSGTTTMSAAVTQPEATTTVNATEPAGSTLNGGGAAGSPVDAFNKSATNALNNLKQEGQALVSNGSSATQENLSKAADNAGQMLNQAQQQFGQYTNAAGSNANALLNQANQTATQYGTELKNGVQNQAGQLTNQLKDAAQDQFQQAQNQFRNGAGNLVNDTTNQLRATTESVMTKAGDSTQSLMNSAATAMNGGQPLSPLPTTSTAPQPTGGYGMPTAAAPRTLDPNQTVSQPLNSSPLNNSAMSNTAFSTTQPEQPIRIPAEQPSYSTTQPTTTQPTYGAASTAATNPNYGAATTTPNYGAATTPNYGTTTTTPNNGTTPAYGGGATTPAASGTPLQFNQPTVPTTQPATPAYNGATRTNFEQPAPASSAARGGVQQYTVTAQDSYYSVAEKMYGNGGFNKALYEYNRRNNPAADRLQVGGAMLVPDLATLQAQFPELVPTAAATATINPTPLQFPR